jgi:citrate synthase
VKRQQSEDLQPGDRYLSGAEAAEFLGVKIATLYAYVSRGMIESIKHRQTRERAYRLSDLINLRNAERGFHKSDAPGSWMGPAIRSAITDITPQGPTYRGQLGTELALKDTAYEEVAEILWGTDQAGTKWAAVQSLPSVEKLKATLPDDASYLDMLKLVVLLMDTSSPVRTALHSEKSFAEGRRLIVSMAGLLARSGKPEGASKVDSALTASVLYRALSGKPSSERAALINRALVLCADHELNASTLAARIAASCGASMSSCVLSALGSFTGPLHGSASLRVEELILGSMQTRSVSRWLREFLQSNQQIPGFGLALYPTGDPRAKVLLDSISEMSSSVPELRRLFELITCVRELVGEMPNIDAGLAALRFALGLPAGSGAAIFAVGRTAGWIAHAVEQHQYGGMIRPRARYIGK